jgi:hypothetical protein
MKFRRRFKLSEQQRNEMWRRWKAGQSLREIGRTFGKDHVSIQFMLAQQGVAQGYLASALSAPLASGIRETVTDRLSPFASANARAIRKPGPAKRPRYLAAHPTAMQSGWAQTIDETRPVQHIPPR